MVLGGSRAEGGELNGHTKNAWRGLDCMPCAELNGVQASVLGKNLSEAVGSDSYEVAVGQLDGLFNFFTECTNRADLDRLSENPGFGDYEVYVHKTENAHSTFRVSAPLLAAASLSSGGVWGLHQPCWCVPGVCPVCAWCANAYPCCAWCVHGVCLVRAWCEGRWRPPSWRGAEWRKLLCIMFQ